MQAGKLRHRVTIQQATESQDGYGEVTKTWAELVTVWAKVHYLQGREYLQAKTVQASVNVQITMRHYAGITPKMRAVWGSHTFDIEDVVPDDTDARYIVLMCTEAV